MVFILFGVSINTFQLLWSEQFDDKNVIENYENYSQLPTCQTSGTFQRLQPWFSSNLQLKRYYSTARETFCNITPLLHLYCSPTFSSAKWTKWVLGNWWAWMNYSMWVMYILQQTELLTNCLDPCSDYYYAFPASRSPNLIHNNILLKINMNLTMITALYKEE